MPAFENIKECLYMTRFMLEKISIREDILKEDKYKYMFSVELVNKLVLEGMPFRDAYVEVGHRIENGGFEIPSKLSHTHEGSLGNLCNDEIEKRFLSAFKFFEEQKKIISEKEKSLLV